jgi:hypothetical protein
MSEPAPASEPGWYPDPWKLAELRWHDGSAWTGHLHGAVQAQPALALVPDLPAAAATPDESVGTITTTESCGAAVAAFVTALLGLPIVPIVLGIRGRRMIAADGGRLTGGWMAGAGIVLGVINTFVIVAIVLAVVIPLLLLSNASPTAKTNPIGGVTAGVSTAGELQAQANVRQVSTALEMCAAAGDGTYAACDGAALAVLQPGLEPLLSSCGSAGGVCVEAEGTSGYSVSAMDRDGTSFGEHRTEDGQVERICTGEACPIGGTW